MLVTAGLYNGAANGASEQSYPQLASDGSTGSFNGATGSNTIASLGGGNLFNHASIGYTDGNGTFHVLVAGRRRHRARHPAQRRVLLSTRKVR